MEIIRKNSYRGKLLYNILEEFCYEDVKDFQRVNELVVDGIFGINSYTAMYNLILDVVSVDFEGNYFKQVYPKKQIIWHHSAGWDNARGMFDWWEKDGRTHVATSCGITDNGNLYKGFDEKYWAASIGANHPNNRTLDKEAVAIEICNWGELSEKNGKIVSWTGYELDSDDVINLKYKHVNYFEKYTEEEIETLKYWTLLNAMRFGIPLDYKEDDMWSVSNDALNRVPGLYTHNSYRVDKTDVSPQPKLIEMAKSLKDYF